MADKRMNEKYHLAWDRAKRHTQKKILFPFYHCSRTQGNSHTAILFTYSFTGQLYSVIIISHCHDAWIEAGLWMGHRHRHDGKQNWRVRTNVANDESQTLAREPSGPSATASWEPLRWNAFTGNIPCHGQYAAHQAHTETAVWPLTIYWYSYLLCPMSHCICRLLIFISSHSCWSLVG